MAATLAGRVFVRHVDQTALEARFGLVRKYLKPFPAAWKAWLTPRIPIAVFYGEGQVEVRDGAASRLGWRAKGLVMRFALPWITSVRVTEDLSGEHDAVPNSITRR